MSFMRQLQRPNQIGKEHGDSFGKSIAGGLGDIVKGGYFLRDEYRKDKAMETMAKDKKKAETESTEEKRRIKDATRYTSDYKFDKKF